MTVTGEVVIVKHVVWGFQQRFQSQTGSLMWYDLAHLRGGCEVTRLDPNWDRVMMGPTAEMAMMHGSTLN